MATSGSFNTTSWTSGSGRHWYYEISWSIGQYDQTNNRTLISWDTHFRSSDATSGNWYGCSLSINVNGNSYSLQDSAHLYKDDDCGSGSTWVGHNTDGSKSFSISASGDIYNSSVSGSGSWDLTKYARYATVKETLKSKTEASITLSYTTDVACDKLLYSTDAGSSFTDTGTTPSTTSGTVTISDLTANTEYCVILKVRRTDSQQYSQTASTAISTYDYPHASDCPSVTIGETLSATIYNPLARSSTVILAAASTELSRSTTTGTSFSFDSSAYADSLYAMIPDADHLTYTISVVYDISTKQSTGTFNADSTACKPTLSDISYIDTDSNAASITGDSSKIVQDFSTPRYSLTATANNHATLINGTVTVNGDEYSCTISGSSVYAQGGTIDSAEDVIATLVVTDSRGFTSSLTITVDMIAWIIPSAVVSVARRNNFYSDTDFTVDARFTSIGSNAITIAVTATSENSDVVTDTLQDNVLKTIVLNNDYSWSIAIDITDSFGGHVRYITVIQRGMPIAYWDLSLESMSVGMFPTLQRSIEVKNLVSAKAVIQASNTFTISTGSWSATTTTVDGTAYYTYVIALTAAYRDDPNITLSPAGTLPTSAEVSAYGCLDYGWSDSTANTLTLYATSKPRADFKIKVEGVE